VTADKWLADVLDEQKLPDGITLHSRLAAPEQQANLDVALMRRVIINLVENASQALTEPETTPRERSVTVASHVAAGWLEITVEDTGVGIPAEILPKVFDPLFSTRSFGTGLGLAVVKQVVEQHGGKIAIVSTLGKGTRVAILLPLDAVAAKPTGRIAA